jgi:hypothetical protein
VAVEVTASSVPDRGLQARVRRIAGQLTVAGPDGAQPVQLSETAELVWRSVDGRRTVRDVAVLLAAEYDVGIDEVLPDVVEMVAQLAGVGVLAVPG